MTKIYHRKFRSPLYYIFGTLFILFIWGAIFGTAILIWFFYDLPPLDDIKNLPRQPSITMLDKNGNILAVYGDWYGSPIDEKSLPSHLVNALIAIEDKRFFSHFGIDIIGLIRAIVKNTEVGSSVQGGSTLTQQLAKNFLQIKKMYGVYDKSIGRKISEAILALMIEYKFTKKEIIMMYLNRMYMGAGSYGIDAASLRYFGKHATQLNLYESAMLVGLLRAPSAYSPRRDMARAENRTKQVLKSMIECGFISQAAADAAMILPSAIDQGFKQNSVMYFTDWVFDTMSQYIDNTAGEDLDVVVTIDPNIQKIAEQQAKIVMERRGIYWKADQLSLVSMRKDGEVLAIIGGMNYTLSKFNRATQSLRQPGSSFKFFVFLAAMEKGYTPYTLVSSKAFSMGSWRPSNYLHKSCENVSIERGFAESINSVSARLASNVGIKKIIAIARRLGITTYIPNNLTLSLGTGSVKVIEMTGAFAHVANDGYKAIPYGVIQIKNKKGKILYEHKKNEERIIEKNVISKMKQIMESVVAYNSGTGRFGRIKDTRIYAKTGTSQNYRDYWFIGFTDDLVTGIWFGRDNDRPMNNFRGEGMPPTHLWRQFNEKAMAYLKNPDGNEWDEEFNPTPIEKRKFKVPDYTSKDNEKDDIEENDNDETYEDVNEDNQIEDDNNEDDNQENDNNEDETVEDETVEDDSNTEYTKEEESS